MDGRHHSTNPFQRQNDAIRDMELAKQGWRVVRIRNSELTQCFTDHTINQDKLNQLIKSKLTVRSKPKKSKSKKQKLVDGFFIGSSTLVELVLVVFPHKLYRTVFFKLRICFYIGNTLGVKHLLDGIK